MGTARPIERAACIGGGVIGGGWAARLLLNGVGVAIHDPAPDAPRIVAEVLANARRAYQRLAGSARPAEGQLRFAGSLEDAVDGAELVQESVPERLDLKRAVLCAIDAVAPATVPVASSTSGLLPSDLQRGLAHPERILVGHPFNPVYLLPLVEVVGGALTAPQAIDRAVATYSAIGMKCVVISREIDAFVGDRLQEALWREALWLVHDGVATVEEIDDVIRYSFGLRWAQMGVFQTYRIAGGEAGMRHFMNQFGPALQWPWTKLTDVPELTDTLLDRIEAQSDAQAAGATIRELERTRDDNLIAIMEAMGSGGGRPAWGAGALHAHYRRALGERSGDGAAHEGPDDAGICLHRCAVEPGWIDRAGQVPEQRYAQVFGDATDAVLARIGVDGRYLVSGFGYRTVETHLRRHGEVARDGALAVYTRVLENDALRLHLRHSLFAAESDALLATSEQLLQHVDTRAGHAVEASPGVLRALAELAAATAPAVRPSAAGRRVGEGS